MKIENISNYNLFSLTDVEFYMFLEEDKIYLQHYSNPFMAEFFKDLKWFWNKDTFYVKDDVTIKKESANKSYRTVREWIWHCGGRNGDQWIPTCI